MTKSQKSFARSATSRGCRSAAWLRGAGLVLLLFAQLEGCVPAARLHEQPGDSSQAGAGAEGGTESGGQTGGGPMVSPDMQADILVVPNRGLSTTEAGDWATFTVSLRRAPTSNVALTFASSNEAEGVVSPASVTFTPENFAAPQQVVVRGVEDDLVDGDQTYFIRTSPATSDDPAFFGLDPLDVEVENLDNDTAGFRVQPVNGLVTSEHGGEARFSVVLNSPPAANVMVPLSTDNPNEGVATPTSLVFTPINWAAPQLVSVQGVDDPFPEGDITYHVVLGAALSSDAAYNLLDPEDVELVNYDDDSPGISAYLARDAFTTEDGSHTVVELVLHSKPSSTVTIQVESSRVDECEVQARAVSFTPENWAAPQVVVVDGVDDQRADDDQPCLVMFAPAISEDPGYQGFDAPDVALVNRDNDTAALRIALPQRGATGEGAANTTTFEVALASQPTGAVQVNLTSTRADEGLPSPSTLTFTELNWHAPQRVTVTGEDDALADGNQPYAIVVTIDPSTSDEQYAYLAEQWVPLINVDDDSAGILLLPLTPPLTSESGDSASFSMQLASQPSRDVTVALSSSDVTEGVVDPAELTFTPEDYATPQVVTVTGVDDKIADGAQPFRIIVSAPLSADTAYNRLSTPSVWLRNRDDETAGITVSPVTGAVTESGGEAMFSIVLDTQPLAVVDIALSSSDTTEATLTAATVRFTPDDWDIPQLVSVRGEDDDTLDGDQPFSVYISAATSGDVQYHGLRTVPVSLVNADNDASGAQP